MEIVANKYYLSNQSQTRSLKKAMIAGLDLGYSDVGIMEMLDKDNMEGGWIRNPRRRSTDLQIVKRKYENKRGCETKVNLEIPKTTLTVKGR